MPLIDETTVLKQLVAAEGKHCPTLCTRTRTMFLDDIFQKGLQSCTACCKYERRWVFLTWFVSGDHRSIVPGRQHNVFLIERVFDFYR